MMSHYFHFKLHLAILIVVLILSAGCTKVIEVDVPDPEEALVVEGVIENGVPPYVILTRNSPFFTGIDLNDISAYFVNGAQISISRGNEKVQLIEFCIENLPEDLQREVARSFGYYVEDSTDVPDICVYTVPNVLNYYLNGDTAGVFVGRIGETYGLDILAEGKTLTSTTNIPGIVPVSLSWRPDPSTDSLVTVEGTYTDPDTPGNHIRFFTKRNDEPFYPPLTGSAFDDAYFGGGTFTFPIERGQPETEEIDFDTFSYFWKGDTVIVKWSSIDKKSYDFWNTLENDGGDSPFSSPVKIKTNISGGLGVWCGYGTFYDTLYVPLQ